MSTPNTPNNQNQQIPPGHSQPVPQNKTRWDTDVSRSAVFVGLMVIAGMVVIFTIVPMFTGSNMAMRAENKIDSDISGSAGILQRKVDAAFAVDEPGDESDATAPQPAADRRVEEDAAKTPAEREMEAIEQQQEIESRREELREQQREAVPSLLPESPPAPVPLGAGTNY